MWEKVKAALLEIAPAIASAIGGPFAGIAINALSNILLGRSDGNPDEISHAIGSASSEKILEIKKLDIQLQELQNQEMDNARNREIQLARSGKTDWTMSALVIFSMVMYAALVFLNQLVADSIEKDILNQQYGFLTLVFGYYFGSKSKK